MRIEKFERETSESLIIIQSFLTNHTISLALDTGASHTTIDLTSLLIAGIELKNAIRTEKVETANGIIEAFVFKIDKLTALGISKENIEIASYDFFSHNVNTDFEGVLGLDFLNDYKICIDFKKSEITIQ